ncbi:hypothetical protein F4777DRAFT_597461 [Nemania sp. FL0916]|nr:hypothetical protein F4777DRAFT_597461 [Nemania sp. FL0916]
MGVSSLISRLTHRTGNKTEDSSNQHGTTSAGPSPSLWPRYKIPIATGGARFKTSPAIPNGASDALEGAYNQHKSSIHTKSAAFGGHLSTAGRDPCSTFLSSRPKPIDPCVSYIFDHQFPEWFAYPPIRSKKLDPTMSAWKTSFESAITYPQQPRNLQGRLINNDTESTQLKHSCASEQLVDEPCRLQRMTGQDTTHHTGLGARGEQSEQSRPFSKVERLLGSDGSSSGMSNWNLPSRAGSQSQMPYCSGIQSTLNGHDLKEQLPSVPQSLTASAEKISSCPDKPYKVHLPEWFHIAETQGNIQMTGATAEQRFKSLLNYIYQLESAKSQLEYQEKHPEEELNTPDPHWDKHWHQPNPGWRHEHQRERGGLWKCRKGPEATVAENGCRLCRHVELVEATPPAQILDDLMRFIGEAMATVAKDDKKQVLERMSKGPSKSAAPEMYQPLADEKTRLYTIQEDNPVKGIECEISPSRTCQSHIDDDTIRGPGISADASDSHQAWVRQATPMNEEQKVPHYVFDYKVQPLPASRPTDRKTKSWGFHPGHRPYALPAAA